MTETKKIYVEKLTLNVGAGKDQRKLEKGMELIKYITGIDPVKTVTQKRIQGWGLRPGLPVGTKLTLRGEQATTLLPRLLAAKDFIIPQKAFDDKGNMAFGIPEYIDIANIKYNPDLGVAGLEVAVTVARPGYRVKNRRMKSKIGKSHVITKDEGMAFFREQFNIKHGDEQ